MRKTTEFSLEIPDLMFFDHLNYVTANLMIDVRLADSQEASSDYDFHVYGPHLFLMGRLDSRSSGKIIKRRGRHLKVELPCDHVWMEGCYRLLMRHRATKSVTKADFLIDSDLRFHVISVEQCLPLSEEDILCCDELLDHHFWLRLAAAPGLEQLRQETVKLLRIRKVNEKRVKEWKMSTMRFCNHYLICSPTDAYLRQSLMLFKHTALPGDELETVDCSTLYDPTNTMPYEQLNEKFKPKLPENPIEIIKNSEAPQFYSFINTGALLLNGGKVVMKTILPYMKPNRTGIFFTGSRQDIDSLMEQYPSLNAVFPEEKRLEILPYSRFEMVQTMNWRTYIQHMLFIPEAKNKLLRLLTQAYDSGSIRHWTINEIDRYLISQVMTNNCNRQIACISRGEVDDYPGWVHEADIDSLRLIQKGTTYEEALQQLNGMIGLEQVKKSITTLANRIKLYAERRRLGLKTDGNMVCHAIFSGNPGTGKTTVARQLGRIYHSLGLLSRGDVICVDRAKIVGRFIGDTEANMMQLLEEARGNVLFIDEAYTLYSSRSDNDFGKRAIECLLTVLTQKNPDMLVILAGYEEEMEQLMSMNPGLVGRFPFKVKFCDYKPDELMQIAESLLASEEYLLTMEARSALYANIKDITSRKSAHFSNARWVEQYVRDGIIPAMADRLAAVGKTLERDDYQRIEAADVMTAYELFNPRNQEIKPRRAVGF